MKKIGIIVAAVLLFLGNMPCTAFGRETQPEIGVAEEELEIVRLDSPKEAAEAMRQSSLKETEEKMQWDQISLFSEEPIEEEETPEEPNRLVVRSTEKMRSTYGAIQGYYYTFGGEYILNYTDRESCEEAYENLLQDYGEEFVFQDALVHLEDSALKDVGDGTAEGFDGIHAMGLDVLREDAEELWDTEATVAVIDSGIDTDHAWFQGRIHSASTSLAQDGEKDSAEDTHGHGTHVSGIVAKGTSGQVDILAIRVFDRSDYTTLTVIRFAIDYAVQNGADVINLSLGDNTAKQSEKNMVDAALQNAVEQGVVVCAAAGNEYMDVRNCYPASSSFTISVGAIKETAPGVYEWDKYSNQGTLLDFVAPGTKIVSAWNDGETRMDSGTSMACPHLSAAAAMVKLKHPDYDQWSVYSVFREHAVDLGEKGKDSLYGYGYVNLAQYARQEGNGENPGKLPQIVNVPETELTKIYSNEIFSLNATCSSGGNLSYSSSDESVAVVNERGEVRMKQSGRTVITVRAEENERYASAVKEIFLIVKKAEPELSAEDCTLYESDSPFELKVNYSGDGELSYVSMDEDVVRIDEKGTVTICGTGETAIAVTSAETPRYSARNILVRIVVREENTPIDEEDFDSRTPFGESEQDSGLTRDQEDKQDESEVKAESVQTSDDTLTEIYLVLAVSALASMMVLLQRKRRQK